MTGTIQIALLRGVMPIGRNRVPMAELRALLTDLGFTDARTLVATGNAVFRSPGPAGAELEALLEKAIADRIGPTLDVMVRDAAAFARIVRSNRFPEDSAAMPSRVQATIFKTPPTPDQSRAFEALVHPPEKARVLDDVAWLVHPNGISASPLRPTDWKAAFGKLSGTARNWNTLSKVYEAAQALA
ncbi:DUF1697 domain-containing protein [Phenylobacterium sp.]|uniref:DUF1697 domain-containing protein n=1 Tax=Phenylobacterium sp. TaxID=1871053 RepID=UPI002E344017|nr:DUF1697 domain-containing protein [Phenylobacterium sp.]HEX2559502.1 DUF1697 domain-containing protein [Phenylobacterium sp.]